MGVTLLKGGNAAVQDRCCFYVRVWLCGLEVQGAGCRVQGAGCRVQGAGCRVQGVGCRVHRGRVKKGCGWL